METRIAPSAIAPAPLPIEAVLPSILASLRTTPNLVLVAPPGAGKTTRVPLALLDEPWAAGRRLILLEPRRLAARAAAERMAGTLGQRVGETVGLRVRSDTRVGPRTRLEVVTEGVFTRMILDDPELEGVAGVLFDEVHERSLEGDLGLALARDAQGLGGDLRLVAMSATLDGAAFARLLGDAPVIEAEGRAYPVETRYLGREANEPLDQAAARATLRALGQESGSVLVFLPGAGEIRRTAARLAEQISDPAVMLAPLYGALSRAEQDAAVAPAPAGRRKVVLATSIAETSLTIEGVRVVIDGGFSRVPRYEPASGLTRLETVRVSRAAADQRRGRAGRTEPGICYRLWDEPQTRALMPQGRPEMLEADLAPLLLALAEWGVADPATLPWLDPPPPAALAEARGLLAGLRAIDAEGRITPHGRRLARLPLAPRLAHMVLEGARLGQAGLAAELAALLSERGLSGRETDLRHAAEAFRRDRSGRARDARDLARSWARLADPNAETGQGSTERAGRLLAAAYPERVAKAREGRPGSFLLASGRGAMLDASDPLARAPFLAVAELGGSGAESRILSAAPLEAGEVEEAFADAITEERSLRYDPGARAVRLISQRRLGAIVLGLRIAPAPPGPAAEQALLSGLEAQGLEALPWTPALQGWRERVTFLRGVEGERWPDLSDEALRSGLAEWLGPMLAGKTALAEITSDLVEGALRALVAHDLQRRVDTHAPTHFDAPSGSRLPIRYEPDGPVLAVRVQELFGLKVHPSVAEGRVPLTLELLSPAHRPVQVTRDLAGFWAGSYAAVRSEMRGRYPKHPWPEDPTSAPATARAKPRGT